STTRVRHALTGSAASSPRRPIGADRAGARARQRHNGSPARRRRAGPPPAPALRGGPRDLRIQPGQVLSVLVSREHKIFAGTNDTLHRRPPLPQVAGWSAGILPTGLLWCAVFVGLAG